MAKLTEKQIAQVVNDGIKHQGKHIILPADPLPGMTYEDAAKALLDKAKEENQKVRVHEIVEGNPFDALAAFHHVLKQEYGWATVKETMSFFGPIPPTMVDIKTGPNPEDVIQAPIGKISAPNMGVDFQVQFAEDGLHLMAECKKCQSYTVKELAAKVRVYLKGNSIYKGKAFRMPKSWEQQPQFLSFRHVNEEELVLNEAVANSVRVNICTPIEHTAEVKADGIPIKRTVLLGGKYGTGKSLTISVIAKLALENNWTVIYLDDTGRIAEAFENAKRWAPCVVAAEDLDRVTNERDDKANMIFNTLSGVLGTNSEVITLLTTNHPEKIERGMLRPGRIDALIEVNAPEADAVKRLIRLYGRGKVDEEADLSPVGEMLSGNIPATIREVVERAKLARIHYGEPSISAQALIAAAHSMGPQITLLNSRKEVEEPTLDKVVRDIIKGVVGDIALNYAVEGHAIQYDAIHGKGDYGATVRNYYEKNKKEIRDSLS